MEKSYSERVNMGTGHLACPADLLNFSPMSTFVLVHGAWQSSGTWDLVIPLLQKHGHNVITPILRGLGNDKSRPTSDVTLRQHIEDVCIELATLREAAVLVGHSYAGMVISGCGRVKSDQSTAIGLFGCLHPGGWAMRTRLASV